MDEKKVIETTLTEYENEQLKLLKSVFDMGCAFKMLALQKEASDWELKYLTEKRDFDNAQGQIGRFLIEVDLLKKELAKKKSDTAREILTAIKEDKSGYWDSCDCGKEELHWRDKCVEDTLRMIAEKYGVDLGE